MHAQQYADSLNAKIEAVFKESDIPGMGISIFNEDTVLFQQGYGFANKAIGDPYSANSVHNIASVSKTFVAVALMQCIEKGLFTLETPINDILPFQVINPNHPTDKILIKHLGHHTSSIVDVEKTWKYSYYLLEEVEFENLSFSKEEKKFLKGISGDSTMSLHDYLKKTFDPEGEYYTKKQFSKNRPGEAHEYSNLGTNLCAYLIEAATGIPFRDYVIKNIYKPLGMTSSGWSHRLPAEAMKAQTYLASGDPYPAYTDVDYPAGNAASNVADLRKFVMDMMNGLKGNGKLLSTESYNIMMEPVIASTSEPASYGIFWYTHRYLGDRMHGGSGGDVAAEIGFNMEEELGYIILCNHGLYPQKQSESYTKVWKNVIKYRQLMAQKRKDPNK